MVEGPIPPMRFCVFWPQFFWPIFSSIFLAISDDPIIVTNGRCLFYNRGTNDRCSEPQQQRRRAAPDDRREPLAIILRDAITGYLQRLFEVELEDTTCFLCTELLHDFDVGLVVVVAPVVPAPTRICCAPVCTRCWTELPELGELMHAVGQRYRTWLPNLVITLHPEAGHS